MDYLDFDLQVEAEPTPDTYKVSVLASPKGEASGQMTFPFNADALENVILKLGRTRSGIRAIGSSTQDVAQKFGSALYEAVFGGEVGTCFRRSLDAADAAAVGLNGFEHQRFLSDYYSGLYPGSPARGLVFQENPDTGDRRISGAAASLLGMESGALPIEAPYSLTILTPLACAYSGASIL